MTWMTENLHQQLYQTFQHIRQCRETRRRHLFCRLGRYVRRLLVSNITNPTTGLYTFKITNIKHMCLVRSLWTSQLKSMVGNLLQLKCVIRYLFSWTAAINITDLTCEKKGMNTLCDTYFHYPCDPDPLNLLPSDDAVVISSPLLCLV